MTAIHVDSSLDDQIRRQCLYAGDLFVYSPTPTSLAFCEFARELLRQSFGARDPERAQYGMPVSEYAALLSALKPHFIHHPKSKRFIRDILRERGCGEQDTYFDVPRLRTSTSDGYLTTGIAYAFHPHRDTWYSAPLCQVNWWMPVIPISRDNGMAFHPRYWNEAVPNTSATYDYQRWTASSRFTAAQHVGKDTREQPRPTGLVEATPDLRFAPPVGGTILFSAAHLHSSLPNTSGRTRFSIDFRTVSGADAQAFLGAPNVDSSCTGSSMPDYLHLADLEHLPSHLIDRYLSGRHRPLGVA